MGALKLTSPHDLSVQELLKLCEGIGLRFSVLNNGEKLRVTGNLAIIDHSIKDAIQAQRDELLALVWCQAHGVEYVTETTEPAMHELTAFIHTVCDQAPHTVEHRAKMFHALKRMRPMDVPVCIEHFKQCVQRISNGTYWHYKNRANQKDNQL